MHVHIINTNIFLAFPFSFTCTLPCYSGPGFSSKSSLVTSHIWFLHCKLQVKVGFKFLPHIRNAIEISLGSTIKSNYKKFGCIVKTSKKCDVSGHGVLYLPNESVGTKCVSCCVYVYRTWLTGYDNRKRSYDTVVELFNVMMM